MPLAVEDRLSAAVELLVSVTIFAALVVPTVCVPKASLVGPKVSGRSAMPLNATVWGESGALSVRISDPVSAPDAAGAKLTCTVQDLPGFNTGPQVLIWVKLGVVAMELRLTVLLLVLVRVTVFAALVVPSTCGAKPTENGEAETTGLSATVKGRATKAARAAPDGKLSAHTWKAPGFAICVAVTGTEIWVGLMKFTVGKFPFADTTVPGAKPVPFSVRVNAALPVRISAGERRVKASGVAEVL